MAEQKENEKAPEPEGELKRASPENSEVPKITARDRADYWREQDPKYQ